VALIKCPDCGRDVSDLAPACLGCGRPIAGQSSQPPSDPGIAPPRALTGVLPSNLGEVARIEPSRPRAGFPTAIVLGGLLFLIAVAAAILLLTSGRSTPTQAATSNTPATSAAGAPQTPLPIIAANPRRSTGPAAPQPDVNGVPCDALESTIFHIHMHLAIFVDGQEQLVPFGIGIGQPWQVEDSAEGPFVTDGSCFYWIHTHTEDGVIHIESPVRRRFTLGDFFAIWQVPLSANQVGPAQGPVIAYVNGSRDDTSPADIPLLAHERIQLDVRGDVPPYVFDFPPGD
jgi:hypothetical protein